MRKYHETYLSRMRGHQGLVKVHIMTKLSYEMVSWDLSFSYLYNPRAMTVRRWSHEMSSASHGNNLTPLHLNQLQLQPNIIDYSMKYIPWLVHIFNQFK